MLRRPSPSWPAISTTVRSAHSTQAWAPRASTPSIATRTRSHSIRSVIGTFEGEGKRPITEVLDYLGGRPAPHPEIVVGAFDHLERGTGQRRQNLCEQVETGERVAGPRQEQHRDRDGGKMDGAQLFGSPRRVQ